MDTRKEIRETDRDFSRLYHEIVDSGLLALLSNAAARVYWVILRYADYRTLLSYPTVETIVKRSGVNKNRISSATKELVKFGLIKKFRTGKEFGFRNGYLIIEHPKIIPHIIPRKKDKRREMLRGKDGKFKPVPKNMDNSVPQNTDNPIPQIKESDTCPQNTDKKENLETNIRDNLLEKKIVASPAFGSEAPFGGKNRSIKNVNPDIIKGLIRDKGLRWTREYLRKEGYPEEEVQGLVEIARKDKDVKQDKTD